MAKSKDPLDTTCALRPFLRWAGSKRKLVHVLSSFWQDGFSRYLEPFMGSACLYFALRPKQALLSDINPALVSTFVAVRDHPAAVHNRLTKIPLGKESYNSLRKRAFRDLEPIQAAAHFIFLNRYCFNGLYRTNLSGQFNVPYAASGTGQLPSRNEMFSTARALQTCDVRHSDFEEILKSTSNGDFVYLDPPYAVGNRRVFRQYDPSSFGIEDLERLSNSLDSMDSRQVKFVLSYAYCKEALDVFKKWPIRKLFVQRNIAGFATDRKRAAELLITNCT